MKTENLKQHLELKVMLAKFLLILEKTLSLLFSKKIFMILN